MPTREDMQSLGQEIIGAYEARVEDIAHIRKETHAQLQEFDEAHAAMGRELRARLSQDEAERRSVTAQEIARRQSDVAAQLKGYRDEQAGARAAWQEFAAGMAAKRGGAVAVAEAPATAEEEGEEEAVARAEVGMVTPEFASLTDTVCYYLSDHPNGTRLTELEAEFGMNRFEAARVMKRLMDEGRAEKRDLLYFAI